jgi:branched-chain amino acid transport system substrate-binding protein
VCLSPSAPASEAARRSRYFYRLYSRDEAEGFTAARYLRQQAGVRTVVVLTDGSQFTRSIETEFRQQFTLLLGGRIEATIRIGEEDWRRRAGDLVRAHDPDGVYVVGHGDRVLEALEMLRTSDYSGVRCTNSHVYVADVLGQAGDLLDGIVFPIAPADVAAVRDPLLDFARRFEDAYGRSPDAYAAQGYDAMRVAIRAVLTSAAPDPEEVRRVLDVDIGAFGGVMGTLAFGVLADPDRRPAMHTVRSGRVVPVDRLRRLQREALEVELGLRLGVQPSSMPLAPRDSGPRT